MSDSQAKRTLPRMLISLLITLPLARCGFMFPCPPLTCTIQVLQLRFYPSVVYILVFMIILGVDTGHQEIHLKDYLSFAKNQCKIVVLIVVVMAAIFVVGQLISRRFSAPAPTMSCWMWGQAILPRRLNRSLLTRFPCWMRRPPVCWVTGSWGNCPTWSANLTYLRTIPRSTIRTSRPGSCLGVR